MADLKRFGKGVTGALAQAKQLATAEREANLQKFLEPSKTQMRLYHGTTATEGGKGQEAIRRIKPSKEGALGSGVYLTPNTAHASGYTGIPNDEAIEAMLVNPTYQNTGLKALNQRNSGNILPEQEGGNMLPVYAQLKNPLIIEGTHADPMIEALVKLGVDEDKAANMVEKAYEQKGYIGKQVENRARAAGYDGLMQYRDGDLSEVVSYNPSAVKSATGNEGTYDIYNPDLSKATGGLAMADGGDAPKPIRFNPIASRQRMNGMEISNAGIGADVDLKDAGRLSGSAMATNIARNKEEQQMQALNLNYGNRFGDVGVDVGVSKPLDRFMPKDLVNTNMAGSIPLGDGRLIAGVHGNRMDGKHRVGGRFLGYNTPLGGGNLNVNINKPVGAPAGMQVQYGKSFADGGKIAKGVAGALTKAKDMAKASKGTQDVLPAAERDANLAKFLEPSQVKGRMYHGTSKDFSAFDRLASTKFRRPSMDTVGSWFSSVPEKAERYAGFENRLTMPVHLNIKNPKLYAKFDDFLRDMHEAEGRDFSQQNPKGLGSAEGLREKLKAQGYDGIQFEQTDNESIYNEVMALQDAIKNARKEELSVNRVEREPFTMKRERLQKTLESMNKEFQQMGGSTEFDGHDVFVAFEPTQIKSAIGNRGTYDIEDADITKADGGKITRGAMGALKKAVEMAKDKKAAPTIIIPGNINSVKEAIRQSKGNYGARRVERAADEIPNLERLFKERALMEAFDGDNARALMTMNPADFERFAKPLQTTDSVNPEMTKLANQGDIDKHTVTTEEYIKYLQRLQGGYDDVPFLGIKKQEQGLPLTPSIDAHEGRHRSRAMADKGETSSLVRLLPRGELREPFPRRSQEDFIEALKEELALTDNMVMPEKIYIPDPDSLYDRAINRPAIKLPDIYAKGGKVPHMADGKLVVGKVTGALTKAKEAARAKKASESKMAEVLEAQQAPMTRPQGTGLPLMPRDQGMYTPREQKDLPRMPVVDKARAAGKSPKYNERMQDLLDSPTARKKVDSLINKGKDLNMREWYGTEPLRQVAMDAGRTPEQFESLMAQLASASQRNPVDKQNQMGSYLYYLSESGQLPENSLLLTNKLKKALKEDPSLAEGRHLVELPTGYGSLAQGDIFNRAVMIGQGNISEALPPNKKLGTFYENLLGNLQPVTVDVNAVRGPIIERGDPRWLTSKLVEKDETGKVINSYKPREMVESGEMTLREAKQRPGFWEAAPSGSEYAGFEDLWQRGAKRHGVAPAEAQALGWYGSADVTALKTKPENYVDNLERMIKRTAEQTGKSPSEVMDDLVTGKGFLRKEGGAVDRNQDMTMKMADLRLRAMVDERMGMAQGGKVSIFDAPVKRMSKGGSSDEPTTKEIAEQLGKMAVEQGKEEYQSFKKPRAATDIGNRGILAPALGLPVDMMNMGLSGVDALAGLMGKPTRLSSEKPFAGSEHIKDLMNKYGVTSGEDRPMTETMLSLFSPTGMVKGAQGATKGAVKAAGAMRKPMSGLGAMREKAN